MQMLKLIDQPIKMQSKVFCYREMQSGLLTVNKTLDFLFGDKAVEIEYVFINDEDDKIKFCHCGCEAIVERLFLKGHWARIGLRKYFPPNNPSFCQCGCEGYTKWDNKLKRQNKFINGHNYKGNAKEIQNRPDVKLILIEAQRKSHATPQYKERGSASCKKSWQDPDIRKSRVDALQIAQKRPEVKEKKSKKMLEKWGDPIWKEKQLNAIFSTNMEILPNKPEIFLMTALENLYPGEWRYTGDFSFIIGGKNPDFVNINGQKKCIEHYGSYWHRNDNPQDRIDLFAQYGWECLVIWEDELKNLTGLRRKLFEFCEPEEGLL